MIEINSDRCTGCGECVEVCPAGALSIQAGRALVDQALCQGCQACVSACLAGAVLAVAAPVAMVVPEQPPLERGAQITVQPSYGVPMPRRQPLLSALAAVISFAGRELVPPILQALASMPNEQRPAMQPRPAPGVGQSSSGGLRARQRQRGRHGRA